MWYTLTIFIIVFQLVISMALPIFPVTMETTLKEDTGFNSENWWDRLFNTDYIFGVAMIEIEPEVENNYPGMPAITTPADLEDLEKGANPLETFIGIMAFKVHGAEFLSLIFWLCDLVLLLCFIKLLRGS